MCFTSLLFYTRLVAVDVWQPVPHEKVCTVQVFAGLHRWVVNKGAHGVLRAQVVLQASSRVAKHQVTSDSSHSLRFFRAVREHNIVFVLFAHGIVRRSWRYGTCNAMVVRIADFGRS